MTKDIIYFSHANGFPGSTYRTLFSYLEEHFDVQYTDVLGHNLKFPMQDNWTNMTQELIEELDNKKLPPVIGVGHSLGGSITLFAAIERPDLFKCIILLDSPIFSFLRAKIVQLFKRLGKADWITPGGRAKRRKSHWSSLEEVINHFKNKPLFRQFNDQCLRDYATYGTVSTKDGLTLKFDPEIEAQIYFTLPHNYSKFKNKLKVPGFTIVGENSDVVKESDIKYMKKYFNIDCIKIRGGHLFPFEFPEKTAELITAVCHLV